VRQKTTLMAINWPKNLTRNKETHSEEGLFLFILFHSGAPAEPHTHIGKKRKPVNSFSHGYHG